MDREQRKALREWFKKYRNYATKAQLTLGPRAVQLDGMPTARGYKDTDRVFLRYHDCNQEAQKRLQAVINLKEVGDKYALYGDVIYYRLMLELPMESLCSRLYKYHKEFDIDDEEHYYPTPPRITNWTRQALDEMAVIVPEEWYLSRTVQ